MNHKDIERRLSRPFKPSEIDWRVAREVKNGNGVQVLAYLQARAVMQRLDEVFGVDGWRTEIHTIAMPNGKMGFTCTLSCFFPDEGKFGGRWVSKTDGAEESDIESFKGGLSGALKRAAVQFGIGRYLYYLGNTYAELVNGKPVGKESNYHKGKYWVVPELPAFAQPDEGEEAKYRSEAPLKRTAAPADNFPRGGNGQANGTTRSRGDFPELDTSQFSYRYKIPYEIEGVDMRELRSKLKELGCKFKGKPDNAWYSHNQLVFGEGDNFLQQYEEYIGGGAPAAAPAESTEVPFEDDINF